MIKIQRKHQVLIIPKPVPVKRHAERTLASKIAQGVFGHRRRHSRQESAIGRLFIDPRAKSRHRNGRGLGSIAEIHNDDNLVGFSPRAFGYVPQLGLRETETVSRRRGVLLKRQIIPRLVNADRPCIRSGLRHEVEFPGGNLDHLGSFTGLGRQTARECGKEKQEWEE